MQSFLFAVGALGIAYTVAHILFRPGRDYPSTPSDTPSED